jgi:hypothetical protein
LTKRRNAQAQAAWSRKGGAHTKGTKRPDPDFDYDVDDYVRILVEGPFHDREGRVVVKDNGVWGISFGDEPTVWFLTQELERV